MTDCTLLVVGADVGIGSPVDVRIAKALDRQ